jgi:ribosomal subunit interface protein
MRLPLQITARNLSLSEAQETAIREKAEKLDQFYDKIMACRIMVEAPHRHQNKGILYHVRIDLTVPEAELVVKREAHEDIYVAIRDAFDAMRRKLQDYTRRRRGETKNHVPLPNARISKLFPDENYGFLVSPDGREVYFHRNSLVEGEFEKLKTGTEVRFREEQGVKGPQATAVWPVG